MSVISFLGVNALKRRIIVAWLRSRIEHHDARQKAAYDRNDLGTGQFHYDARNALRNELNLMLRGRA